MPASKAFFDRLLPRLAEAIGRFGTPFHIYDEKGIRETAEAMNAAFAGLGFRNYYAVKANPNIRILEIMRDCGCGFDCSSVPELRLARRVGAYGDDIMFTSNNTSPIEFREALLSGGCRLNLDDAVLLPKLRQTANGDFPEAICFRYNPGDGIEGNDFIGQPGKAKYGLRNDQILFAYAEAKEAGARRFGLHIMIVSNERDHRAMARTVEMICGVAGFLKTELGIKLDFINAGGGIGVPYHPNDPPFDLAAFAGQARAIMEAFEKNCGYRPDFFLECGRYLTAPHGLLVARVLNRMEKHRRYIGLDACMSNLMRPALYGAYHHIDILASGRNGNGFRRRFGQTEVVDVVGSLCENNDKFAIERSLPAAQEGDIAAIHDVGGHGYAMGFQYNGRLRCAELLLRTDGKIELIRRAETYEDYVMTMEDFESVVI